MLLTCFSTAPGVTTSFSARRLVPGELTRGDGARFVIKRDSLARDWIGRVTADDPELEEAERVDGVVRKEPDGDRLKACEHD
mgnify:CR=1 FL=1